MEQHATSVEALRRRAAHQLQHILSRTPGKSPQAVASEAEAVISLAFTEGNPVRDLFLSATPSREQERPRSPSPTGTIRPKSSRAFFKFGRGRDKVVAADQKPAASARLKTSTALEGVSPLFEQLYGPVEPKKSKRKARGSDAAPPSSSAEPGRTVPASESLSKAGRISEQYLCIICQKELSSKGVYKRHLEDQHIKPTVFECESCHAYFDAKSEAKKHSSQCGDDELSWTATKLAKQVYACEYTGSYFGSLDRYSQHLISLTEQLHPQPRPSLSVKLDAIIRHAAHRNPSLLPLCDEISDRLFCSADAWKDLQWDTDYIQAKIADLEHATFNADGTIESARWTGSLPKLENTRAYLTRLLEAGRPRSASASPTKIKPEAMSIRSTPVPVSHGGQSAASSTGSADTSLRVASPLSRSQSRQTVWSHDGVDQSTTASTPRSVPAGDDALTVELKSKRHLSDESRSFNPTRTPPGPPDLPGNYGYHIDPSFNGQAPQLPPLPAFETPSGSTISLPLRKQEGNSAPLGYCTTSAPYQHSMYPIGPTHSSHTLSSDGVSETSTLAQSYREPEYSPVDYDLWSQHLAYPGHHHPSQYGYGGGGGGGNFDYPMPDDASLVASSITTGTNTIVDYTASIPKMEDFSEMDLSDHGPHGGTFFLQHDDVEDLHR